MQLITYTDADIGLTEELETDPEVMRELGGAIPASDIRTVHERRLRPSGADQCWLKIVPRPGAPAVGTIGAWPSEWQGEELLETGWMVLPAHQGRGIAGEALGMLLERLRRAPIHDAVHAFPGQSNAPSNALCRRHGFTLLGPAEADFRDRTLAVNHWRLPLRAAAAS